MKTAKAVLSAIICFCMILCCAAPVFASASAKQTAQSVSSDYDPFASLKVNRAEVGSQLSIERIRQVFSKIVNVFSNFFLNWVVAKPLETAIPSARSVQRYEKFDLDSYGNFYEGHSEFLSVPAADSAWRLGYSSKSIMPSDFGEKKYAKGAYVPYIYGNEMYKDDDGESEELRVRTIVVDDSSGRGAAAFCSIDAIGLANADVRLIREALADFAAENNIVSINVSATHIHTGIDSQGVWTDPLGTASKNMLKLNVTYGVDRTFLQAIIDGTRDSVKEAFADMTKGRLYYSSVNIKDYVSDRTAPKCVDDNLYKLEFIPDDSARTPTIIATFGCHPESASYDWDGYVDENGKKGFDRKFSSDFIWYMEKVINAAGFNFIFIQGNVGTITSSRGLSNDNGLDTDAHSTAARYGYEMGYITLCLNMSEAERIRINEATGDRLGIARYSGREGYTKWYDGLPTVEAVEVEPFLNIAHRQFFCPVDNNLITIIGKTAVADNLILKSLLGQYYTVTEVGYMELGNALKVYISPGETFTELLKGGSGIEGFEYNAIRDVVGENTIIFDLMNDAAGYVANDANYVMLGLQYNDQNGELDTDSWCLISFGKKAGSTFIGNFYELVNEKRPKQ